MPEVNWADGASANRERFTRIHESFLDMETELDLFDWDVDGVPMWERIRFGVYRDVMQKSGVLSQSQQSLEKDLSGMRKGASLWLRNMFSRSPYFGGSHDILVWGHERRRKLENGNWWDVIFDPLLERIDLDTLLVETEYDLAHRTPAQTENIAYLDFITFSSTIYRKLAVHHSTPEPGHVAAIESAIESRFGSRIDVGTRVYEEVTDRRVYLPMYRLLLRRVDPAVVLLAVSYGKESFIEACHREGIPVVELQHGTIEKYHMGYSFPGYREKRDAPDYLFTFGPFWSRGVSLPVPDEKVFDVGYTYLEDTRSRTPTDEETNEVVFVSQGTIGPSLSKLAVKLSSETSGYNVTYKLHPGEYDRWREAYPWLKTSDVTVYKDEIPLYELLARAHTQVGVYSTALFEGLCFDQRTVLVDLPGIQYMDSFVTDYGVPVVSDVDELVAALETVESQDIDRKDFFVPESITRFERALREVKQESAESDGAPTS